MSDTHGDEGKVSHLVQAESATRHALSKEWEVVGSFEDLDVSAEITPWKQPDLGPWLTERQGERDALVWAKVDRAFRSAKDCADVAHWAEENHKVLVFTDDGITLDYRKGRESSFGNELAKVFLMLASIFAEMELKRIKAMVTAAHKHLRKTDRWAGGQPPYGYRIVDRPGGGRTLEPDPVTSEAVRYMGKLLLEGQSQWMIATALEAAGFDTQAMKDLREEKRRNLFDYPGGDDEYSEALETLVDERRRLAALPQRPSAWVEVETGQTFADAWSRADQERRRQLLLGLKARLYMTPTIEGWYLPAELEARVRQTKCAESSASGA
ncbi:recombinase family protein [Kitasatospora arboriphila]|uniref:recombinase family protein n=1 Tax=Kitasatospora arboriphila TaxID=258052 RepID=UPI0031CEE868